MSDDKEPFSGKSSILPDAPTLRNQGDFNLQEPVGTPSHKTNDDDSGDTFLFGMALFIIFLAFVCMCIGFEGLSSVLKAWTQG